MKRKPSFRRALAANFFLLKSYFAQKKTPRPALFTRLRFFVCLFGCGDVVVVVVIVVHGFFVCVGECALDATVRVSPWFLRRVSTVSKHF